MGSRAMAVLSDNSPGRTVQSNSKPLRQEAHHRLSAQQDVIVRNAQLHAPDCAAGVFGLPQWLMAVTMPR